jgi:hypothetical protein
MNPPCCLSIRLCYDFVVTAEFPYGNNGSVETSEEAVVEYIKAITWNLSRTENHQHVLISVRCRWSRFELGTSEMRGVITVPIPLAIFS